MTTLLRLAFVSLILLGLASQAIRVGRSGEEADPRRELLGRLQRLGAHATVAADPDLLIVQSSRCGQPFVVGLLPIDGAGDEMARPFANPDTVVRYVYLGAVEDHPTRPALLARWAWATLLFDIGLRPGRPSRHMAMVAAPRSCTGLDGVDWPALSPGS